MDTSSNCLGPFCKAISISVERKSSGATYPFPVRPLLLEQELVVVVGESGGGKGPGTLEAGPVGVAAAESVSAGQGNNLAVVKAHAVEDGPQVAGTLGGVGKTAVGGAERHVAVGAARAPGNDGTLHLLEGADTGENPEVRVGDPRELSLDGLEEIASGDQTGVGAVVTLGSEPHGGTVAATSAGHGIVCARGVPGKTDQDGAVAAVIVLIVFNQSLGNGVVDLLVVGLGGGEDGVLEVGRAGAGVVEPATSTCDGGDGDTGDQASAAAASGRSIAALALLLERGTGGSDPAAATDKRVPGRGAECPGD